MADLRRVWAAGLPCPEPLTGIGRVGALSVHAETWIPGGEVLRGDGPEIAGLSVCATVTGGGRRRPKPGARGAQTALGGGP